MNLGDSLYKEIILDHYRAKKNRRRMEDADLVREGANPSCGDDIELFLKLDGTTIEDCSYEGVGCSICVASANMLCEGIRGKTIDEARELGVKFRTMLTQDGPADFPEEAEDLEAMQGVKKFPVRVKCALLAWTAFEQMTAE